MPNEVQSRRPRLSYPQVAPTATPPSPVSEPVTESAPAPRATGPSWWQFLLLQAVLLLGAVALFSILAFALIAKAPQGGTAAAETGTGTAGAGAVASTAPTGNAGAASSAAATPARSGTPGPVPANAARLGTPQLAAPAGSRGEQTVKVQLEVREVVGLLDEGLGYEYWTFNGTVPGPMIRVKQGDKVELTLTSAASNKVAHSIDLHAVTGPGGGSEVTMVAPGQSKTFTFKATQAGVFVYQSGSNPLDQQLASGLYGLIVVEPPQGLPTVTREYYVMQGEFYLDGKRDLLGQRVFSADKASNNQPDYVVFNGAVNALGDQNAIRMKTGETIRIFFGVGGPNRTSNLRVVGELFDRVASDGTPLSDPTRWATGVQSTIVPIGGAAIVEIKADVPGRYTLIDANTSNSQKGAVGTLIVEGPEDPGIFAPQR